MSRKKLGKKVSVIILVLGTISLFTFYLIGRKRREEPEGKEHAD